MYPYIRVLSVAGVTDTLRVIQSHYFVISTAWGGRVLWRCCSGWSGGAKVSYILHHLGVQLILACSWAVPAILVAGKGRGRIFFISSVSSVLFLLLFLPCSSLSSPLLSLLSLFSLSLGDDTKWPTRVDMLLNPNTTKSQLQDTPHSLYNTIARIESRNLVSWTNMLYPN